MNMALITALAAGAGFIRFGVLVLAGAIATPPVSAEEFGHRMTVGLSGMVLCSVVLGSALDRLLP